MIIEIYRFFIQPILRIFLSCHKNRLFSKINLIKLKLFHKINTNTHIDQDEIKSKSHCNLQLNMLLL